MAYRPSPGDSPQRPLSPGSDRDYYDDDHNEEDDASFNSTPPLPPPFSPEGGPSYEALEHSHAAKGSHGKAGKTGDKQSPAQPLLDDCFPRPPPRDLAASAMIAANSALGATSPLGGYDAMEGLDDTGDQDDDNDDDDDDDDDGSVGRSGGGRGGARLGEVSGDEDDSDDEEAGDLDNSFGLGDASSLQNMLRPGDDDDDGLVGTTPSTAHRHAGKSLRFSGEGLLGGREAETPLGLPASPSGAFNAALGKMGSLFSNGHGIGSAPASPGDVFPASLEGLLGTGLGSAGAATRGRARDMGMSPDAGNRSLGVAPLAATPLHSAGHASGCGGLSGGDLTGSGNRRLRARMGTAPGEPSPFDNDDDNDVDDDDDDNGGGGGGSKLFAGGGDDGDDDGDDSGGGGPADDDEELTEMQQKMAEELGMFGDAGGDSDGGGGEDEDEDDMRALKRSMVAELGYAASPAKAKGAKAGAKAKAFGSRRGSQQSTGDDDDDDDGGVGGGAAFSVTSWSGAKEFDKSWNEGLVAMPESDPGDPSRGDRWRSPVHRDGGNKAPQAQASQQPLYHPRAEEEYTKESAAAAAAKRKEPKSKGLSAAAAAPKQQAAAVIRAQAGPTISPVQSPRRKPRQTVGFADGGGDDVNGNGDQSDGSDDPLLRGRNRQWSQFHRSAQDDAEGEFGDQDGDAFGDGDGRGGEDDDEEDDGEDENDDDDDDDDDAQGSFKLMGKPQRRGQGGRNKDNDKEGGDVDDHSGGRGQGAGAGGQRLADMDANERHKSMLAALGEEMRKAKQDEADKQARLAERKRKKTEALIASARLRKQGLAAEAASGGGGGGEDGGKADKRPGKDKEGEAGSFKSAARRRQEAAVAAANLTSADLEAAAEAEEEERKAARLRRKQFKAAHKKHLMDLIEKRNSELLAEEEARAEEEERIKEVKEKGLRLARLRKKQLALADGGQAGGDGDSPEKAAAGGGGEGDGETPRGSGVAAVRAARGGGNSGGAGKDKDGGKEKGAPGEAGEDGVELSAEAKAERKARRREMKAAIAKHQELLKAMAEAAAKKKADDALEERRLERRAALKREKILLEGAERKRLAAEEVKAGVEAPAGKDKGDGEEDEEEAAKVAAARKKRAARAAAKKAADAAAEANKLVPAEGGANRKGGGGDKKKKPKKPGSDEDDDEGNDDDDDDENGNDDDSAGPKAKAKAAKAAASKGGASQALTKKDAASVARLHGAGKESDGAGGSEPVARDFDDWKKKHGVPLDAKVFGMTGWYPCVKQALLDRGWYFNADRDSFFFDLKWTLKSNELKQEQLLPHQLTNHFLKNTALTTKVGLLKSLKDLSWHANCHQDSIYPRSYDLNCSVDMQAFLDDYRVTTAMGMLKEVVHRCRLKPSVASGNAAKGDSVSERVRKRSHFAAEFLAEDFDASVVVNGGALDVALRVCGRMAFPALDDDAVLDSAPGHGATAGVDEPLEPPVTDLEWEVLGHASKQLNNEDRPSSAPDAAGPGGERVAAAQERPVFRAWDPRAVLVPGKPPRPLDGFLAKLQFDGPDAKKDARAKQEAEKQSKRKAEQHEADRRRLGPLCCGPGALQPVGLTRLEACYETLAALDAKSPQCALNGRMCTKNLWIVKPSAKSRGRGIQAFRDIGKLLDYIGVSESTSGQSSTLWVVQKYMENPLIVARRKFDIRQWVLVTDWNPLTIYFYESCYARFSAAEYSDRDEDLENEHVHLVNNSIAKNSDAFHDKVVAENGVEIKDCMWSRDQIAAFMKFKAGQRGIFKGHDEGVDTKAPGASREGEDVYQTRCMKLMREITKCALMTAQGAVEARKNSWELYGYDFMFDDDFRPWLIEINSSPACDYSTSVTEAFVPVALTDVVKVVVDLRAWEAPGGGRSRGEARPGTGGWEPIYKGPALETQRAALSCDLACVGVGVFKGRARGAPPGFRPNVAEYPRPEPCHEDDEEAGEDVQAALLAGQKKGQRKGGAEKGRAPVAGAPGSGGAGGAAPASPARGGAAAAASHSPGPARANAAAAKKAPAKATPAGAGKAAAPRRMKNKEDDDEQEENDNDDDDDDDDNDVEEDDGRKQDVENACKAERLAVKAAALKAAKSSDSHLPLQPVAANKPCGGGAVAGKQAPRFTMKAALTTGPPGKGGAGEANKGRKEEEDEEEDDDDLGGTGNSRDGDDGDDGEAPETTSPTGLKAKERLPGLDENDEAIDLDAAEDEAMDAAWRGHAELSIMGKASVTTTSSIDFDDI